ncbi:MAG: FliH/SctL family protein [bacterium]|nr:FliH/SctL family protein [bacterium]
MRPPKQTDPLEATTVKSRRHSYNNDDVSMEEPIWVKPNPVKHIPSTPITSERGDPFQLARKLASERNEERDNAVNAAYAKGYAEGSAVADAAAHEKLVKIAEQLDDYAQSIDTKLETIYQELAPTITKLALEIAKKAVATELTLSPILVTEIAKQICKEIGDRSGMTVRFHPDDVTVLQQAGVDLTSILSATNKISVEPSHGIARGGCIVETIEGQWDGRIETRWNEITNSLLELSGETSERIDE